MRRDLPTTMYTIERNDIRDSKQGNRSKRKYNLMNYQQNAIINVVVNHISIRILDHVLVILNELYDVNLC